MHEPFGGMIHLILTTSPFLLQTRGQRQGQVRWFAWDHIDIGIRHVWPPKATSDCVSQGVVAEAIWGTYFQKILVAMYTYSITSGSRPRNLPLKQAPWWLTGHWHFQASSLHYNSSLCPAQPSTSTCLYWEDGWMWWGNCPGAGSDQVAPGLGTIHTNV